MGKGKGEQPNPGRALTRHHPESSSSSLRRLLPTSSPPAMPFFDEASYSLSLRHHHTLASSFTSGLVFSPCGLYLASLSSSPRLTVTALSPSLIPSSHSSWRPVTSPGVARALAAGRGGLYVAGDFGLVRTAWEKENPTPVVEDVPVERICAVAGAIVGVVKGGWIVVVDEAHARPCAMLGGDIDVGCVAPVPDGTGFLAVCTTASRLLHFFRFVSSPSGHSSNPVFLSFRFDSPSP